MWGRVGEGDGGTVLCAAQCSSDLEGMRKVAAGCSSRTVTSVVCGASPTHPQLLLSLQLELLERLSNVLMGQQVLPTQLGAAIADVRRALR